MKIYQTLKPQWFVIPLISVMLLMLMMVMIAGDFSMITPQLILLMIELAALCYGIFFGKNHLTYCAPEIHGYKYFRSVPNFENHFKKQCIISDIVCYGIGYAVTILNFIFMADKELSAVIGILYLFIIALSVFISAFVNTSHRLYMYTMMFSAVPLVCGTMVFLLADDIPENLIPVNVQLIILACVTVFAIISEILFYKRLGKNLRTSYGKG